MRGVPRHEAGRADACSSPPSALDDLDADRPGREIWIRGDRDEILATLDAAGDRLRGDPHARRHVVDQVSFLTVSWTFGFMQSLGVAAGVLVARRRRRLPRRPPPRPGARLRLRPAHGPHPAPAPPGAARRAGWPAWASAAGWGSASPWSAPGWPTERIDPVPEFRPDPAAAPGDRRGRRRWRRGRWSSRRSRRCSPSGATDRDDPLEVLRAGT